MSSASDNFNRANGSLGSNWTTAAGGFEIVSNQVRGTHPDSNNYAYWSAAGFSATQYSQVTVRWVSGEPSYGVTTRFNSQADGYTLVVRFWSNGDPRDIRLARVDGGVFTLLQSYVEAPVQDSVYRLEAEGSTLRAYRNGTKFGSDASDGSHVSGQPGIRNFSNVGFIDDWSGGNLGQEPTRGRISMAELQVPVVDGGPGSGGGGTWTNLVNTTFIDGVLTKVSGGNDTPNAGARTSESIPGDGYLQYTVSQNNRRMAVGLGLVNQWDLTGSSVAYRWIMPPDGYAVPRFHGTVDWDTETAYSPGDVFKIERDGNTIRWFKNNTLVWTQTESSFIGALTGLASISDEGGALHSTVITGGVATPARGRVSFSEVQVPDLVPGGGEQDWPFGFDGWEPNPVTASETITLNPGGNIQTALNTLGSTGGTLILNPGAYTGNIVLPERVTPHPVKIRSATNSNLPGTGQRITRDHKPHLAVITSANGFDPVISANHRAQNFYFENIAIGPQVADRDQVVLGWDRSSLHNVSQRASNFLFDRVLFEGHPVNGQHRGIMLHAKNIIVRGCSFYDYIEYGRDSQCLAGWNGMENVLIENCYLEASGYQFISGGASSARSNPPWGQGAAGEGMQPRKVTIQDCHFRKPIAWKTMSPAPTVKALFELKHLLGGLVQRCLFEGCWAGAWPMGVAVIIKCLNDEKDESSIVTRDFMMRDCIIRDTGIPIIVVGEQDSGPAYPTQRMENVRFDNILAYRINTPPFNGQGQALQVINTGNDTRFNHITWRTNSHSFWQGWYDNGPKTATGLHYTNNAVSASSFGLNMIDDPNVLPGSTMVQKWDNMHPGAVVGGNAIRQGSSNPARTGFNYISQAAWDASFDALHRVIPGSVVAQVQTTDGKMPGADVDDLKAKMPWVTIADEVTSPTRGRISWAEAQIPSLSGGGDWAIDDFNRSDGGLGSSWADAVGSFTIVSQQVRGTSGGNNYAYWVADTFQSDQYSQVRVKPAAGANPSFGPLVRFNASGSGYALVLRFHADGSALDTRLARIDNGVFHLLHTYAHIPVAGSVYRLEAKGSDLIAYRDGVLLEVHITDPTYTTGQPGIRNWSTDGFLDDWEGGNLHTIYTPARGRISWAEAVVPDMVTRGLVSWVDIEVPFKTEVIPPSMVSFTIGGVERSNRVRASSSVDITYRIGSRGVLRLETVDRTNPNSAQAYRPQLDEEIIVRDGVTKLFTGRIVSVRDRALGAPNLGVVTEVEAVDYSRVADARLVTLKWDWPVNITTHMLHLFQDYLAGQGVYRGRWEGGFDPEAVMQSTVWDGIPVSSALNQITTVTGYVWRVTPNQELELIKPGAQPTFIDPVTGLQRTTYHLSSSNATVIGGAQWSRTRGKFANRIMLRAGAGTRDVTEVFYGDGFRREYPFMVPATTIPTQVFVNGQYVHVAPFEEGHLFQWNYATNPSRLFQRPTAAGTSYPPLTSSDRVQVTYNGSFPLTVIAEDPNGSIGIWEEIITEPGVFDKAQAEQIAQGRLKQYKSLPRTVTVRTRNGMVLPGDIVSFHIPERLITGVWLVVEVRIRTEADHKVTYDLTCLEGTDVSRGTWVDYFKAAFGKT